MNENQFLIHIEIADKPYPIWIDRDDEELVRKAAKQIKLKFDKCRSTYSESVDKMDLLAMVAFKLSKESLLLDKRNDTAPFIEKIRLLTEKLETCIDNNDFKD